MQPIKIPRLEWILFWIFIHSCSIWFFSIFLAGLASTGIIVNYLIYVLIMGLGITIVAQLVRIKTRKKQFKINTELFIWVGISAFSFWVTQFVVVSIFYIQSGLAYFILMGCGVYLISLFFTKISMRKSKLFRPTSRKPTWIPYGKNIKIEKEVLYFVNNERKKRNIPPLLWNDSLYQTAQRRASEIKRDFSHNGVPAGCGENIVMSPIGRVRGLGIIHRHNVAKAFLKIWMNSPGHRENILRMQYKTSCMGVIQHNGKYFGVQLFL
jgi:uncharacterized protein YkwD